MHLASCYLDVFVFPRDKGVENMIVPNFVLMGMNLKILTHQHNKVITKKLYFLFKKQLVGTIVFFFFFLISCLLKNII